MRDVSSMKDLYLLSALLFCGIHGLKKLSGGFLSACLPIFTSVIFFILSCVWCCILVGIHREGWKNFGEN